MQQNTPGYEEAFVDVLGARVYSLHAGAGRPMLLVHGLIGSSANWLGNVDALAGDASVYAIDMVNMGRSQRIAGLDAGLEATAERLVAAMDALGLDQADVVAHSHGGAVALMLAARHPERVRSLVLFAPVNPYNRFSDTIVRIYSTGVGRLMASVAPYLPSPLQRYALGRMYGDPGRIAAGCLESYIDGLRVSGTVTHIMNIVHGWFADMDQLAAALPQVADMPTLLVWGDRDRAVDPASAIPLQRMLRGSELRIVSGGGHVVFQELPEESNRLMLEWLRRDLGAPAAMTADCGNAGLRPADAGAMPVRPTAAMRHLSTRT